MRFEEGFAIKFVEGFFKWGQTVVVWTRPTKHHSYVEWMLEVVELKNELHVELLSKFFYVE